MFNFNYKLQVLAENKIKMIHTVLKYKFFIQDIYFASVPPALFALVHYLTHVQTLSRMASYL